MWAVESALLRVIFVLLRVMRPATAAGFGGWLCSLIGPRLPKSNHYRRNFAVAFPDYDPQQIEKLVRESWRNFGASMAEYAHLDDIAQARRGAGIETIMSPRVRALAEEGRPAIFVGAHMANWELPARAIVDQKHPVTAIFTPLQNPGLDALLHRCRRALGCRLVPASESVRPLIAELNAGRSIGLIVDQKVETGELLPLFGRDKMTTLVPARLALRFDCELVPVRVQRLEGSRFRVTICDPVEPEDQNASNIVKARQMMTAVNRHFEDWIRENPGQWYCGNRRWPKRISNAEDVKSIASGAGADTNQDESGDRAA
ncbi:MAG: lysophospholipid acyltransferase family protein [Gammaproteobacteria bacterium]